MTGWILIGLIIIYAVCVIIKKSADVKKGKYCNCEGCDKTCAADTRRKII